jgi:molybdenum cofactor synthesis domain-containing protein
MVPLERAYGLIKVMRDRFYSSLPVERIAIGNSLGRRLSLDITASISSPAHNISTMDGYAVRTKDSYPMKLTGEVFAGDRGDKALGPGESVYITTGAAVPTGADAILKIEDAQVRDGMLYGIKLEQWENIIKAGSDFTEGEKILDGNTVVTPSAIAILCAAGIDEVEAFRKIRAAVISSGDEIRNGMTRDTNAPMVCAMLQTWGCEVDHLGVAPDDPAETRDMLERATSGYDIVITIGGISVGKKDFVASTILEKGHVVFKGYRVRPGKPLLVSYYDDVPVFSLPGKPTGSFTSMELIVRRFILGEAKPSSVNVPMARDMEFSPGEDFEYVVYVQLKDGSAMPMGYEGSPLKLFTGPRYGVSIVSSSPRTIVADGYILARNDVKAGQKVTVNLL